MPAKQLGRGPARGTIVLASATGVPQTFYLRFAQWLVAQRLTATPPTTHTIVTVREGPSRIGHFGLFGSAGAEQIWTCLLALALPLANSTIQEH